MKISNIGIEAFKGKYVYLAPSKKLGIDTELLNKENTQAKRAVKFGVDVPVYQDARDNEGNVLRTQYETIGDPADPKNNPISKKHLKNLFKNLYYLDKAGIYHNDLDPSHIFFSENGGVEIDCFRYSFNFTKKTNGKLTGNNGSIRIPDFIMPSNKNILEEQFIGNYVSKMANNEKDIFIKNYLRECSHYHQKRADMLTDRGFLPSDKTVKYEILQGTVFQNPSRDIIKYTEEKLNFLAGKRAAFTEWDEGNGACGHPVDPMMRFNAIGMHLDCIMATLDLRNKTADLAQSVDSKEKEYFEFELENINMLLKNLYDDTKGMGEWNFKDNINDIYLAGEEELQTFLDLYSEINFDKPTWQTKEDIEIVKKYYANLAYDWNIFCESDWEEMQEEKQKEKF